MREASLKMVRYNADAIRLMRGQHIVGMLLRCADGRWSVCDREEKRLTKATYLQAHMARNKAEELIP